MAQRYKLKLKQLDFVSLVDDPAQPNATCLLIKRKGGKDEIEATARLVKASDELGLAFFWAFTSTNPDGTAHHDHHGDQVLADNDMIRAAAEFMEKGGAVDEMHDYAQTGRVVFAMPMTPEIAKAFGVETKTSGLMIALRPSPEAMSKLKSGEYSAVSIAGLGERETVKSARVAKAQLYTDEQFGHQHKVCVYDDGSLYVEYATMEGAEYGHSHGIVFENGALVILADSGHTHELAEGQPGIAVVPADAIVVVQASANSTTTEAGAIDARAKSTRSRPVHDAGTIKAKDKTMPTEQDKQIADLTKRNERLERIAKMSGAHKAHFDTLSADDQDAFLVKSSAERDAAIKAANDADPVEVEFNGQSYRKSAGTAVIELAKAAKAQAERLAEQAVALEKSRIRKAALDTLGGMPGTDEAHDLIVGSIMKSGAEQKDIDAALACLKGMKATSTVGKGAPGINPGADPTEEQTAVEKLDALTLKYAADNKVDRPTARVAVMKTAEGRRLYAESVGRA